MKERIEKAMLEITEILDFTVFEDPEKWAERVKEHKEEGLESPIPGECTGWTAPPTWQAENESEIRYNSEKGEIELAMRHTNACSCCADQPCYLKWMTIPELVKKLKERYWIVFFLKGEGSLVTEEIIEKLEAFQKNS